MPSVSTAIRQVKFGQRCRAAILGHDARPLGRLNRFHWRRVAAAYCRSGQLRYGEALAIAVRLGAELSASGEDLTPSPDVEQRLRDRFAAELRAAAAGRRRLTVTDADRMGLAVKDALLSGRCPICSAPLPCAGCGTMPVAIDGRGGLIE